MFPNRVLSGMRPTGALHLGHYLGVLKNWVKLQHEYECLYFVADWHALTTHYETPEVIEQNVWEMVVDWLAAGVSAFAAGDLRAQSNLDFRYLLYKESGGRTQVSNPWLYLNQDFGLKGGQLSLLLGYDSISGASP